MTSDCLNQRQWVGKTELEVTLKVKESRRISSVNIRGDAVFWNKGNQGDAQGWGLWKRFGPTSFQQEVNNGRQYNHWVTMNLINVSSLSGGMFNQTVRLGRTKTGSYPEVGVSGTSIEKDQAGEILGGWQGKVGRLDRLSEPTGYVHYNSRWLVRGH